MASFWLPASFFKRGASRSGELDAVIQVAVGCESKKYWNPIGTYRVVIDGTEYMVELEEETERFR